MLKNKKIAIVLTSTSIFLFLSFLVINKTPQKEQKEFVQILPNTEIPLLNPQGNADFIKTILEINNTKYESEVVGVISVYELMDKLRSEGKINFKAKTYIGIGKFIEEINEVRSDGSKYWIYYVNGKKAQVGVSNYKLNPGDVVSWKYEKEIY